MTQKTKDIRNFRKALDKHLKNEINLRQWNFHKQIQNDIKVLNFTKD